MKTSKQRSASAQCFLSILFAIACFAFIAPQAYSYEEDTHFLMTYVLCRSAGFTDEEALVIAAVDQGMDDSPRVNAHDGGKPQIEEEWRWHALDKNGNMHAAGIIARRDQLFNEALEESDPHNRLIRIGMFFHYQQDTWAHRHHEKSNHLSRDAFTTFNTPTGHAPFGSKPDRPPIDPVAALMSLEDGIVYATDFLVRGIKRKPNEFFVGYKPAGGSVDSGWKDKRKGKFFNQILIPSEEPATAATYLKSLIRAQIDTYKRSRDYNPNYFGYKTPDLADLDLMRPALQEVCDKFKSSVGTIVVPTEEQKLIQGFTKMTTEGLLSMGASATSK
jgi:hypothetical protein